MNDQNPARNCLVLLQNREDTAYNDFIGKFYHFPQKYLKLLSVPDAEFIYYEPKKKGEGVYFGYGKILKIFPDKREEGCYFAELAEYKPFSKPVAFVSDDGKPRESGDTYNAQNAVRRVTDDVLDGICLDGGIILNFKADAHLLTVLGEQLISSEQVGILELVKNAYDAGATACTVRIEAISSLPAKESEYQYQQYPGPVIVIRDNGRGMDRFTIEHGWLRPASTIKTDIKERLKKERQEAIARKSVRTFDKLVKALKTEHGGRLPLGEKGVGRFASHRLGRCVVIKTKTAADNFEYVLSIDWDRFNAAEGGEFINLDSVGIALFRSVPSRDYGPSSSGTEIIIHSGRPEYPITIDTIKQIHGTIRNLCSPSNGPQDFKVDFECPQAGNQDEVKYSDQLHPVFSLDALVDEEGIADIDKYFTPPRSVPLNAEAKKKIPWDLRLSEPGHWKGDNDADALRKPSCGRFILHLDLWYRTTPWLEGADYKDFIKHLNDYGGISIFRDGLNVFPAEWGAEMDWLELGKRHIQKGDRLSYREMIGNLEIEQTANLLLVDKTDRQGMIKNEAYRDLAKLVKALVIYIENDFQGKREKFNELTAGVIREPKNLEALSKQGAVLVRNIAAKYDVQKDPLQLLMEFGPASERLDRLINLDKSLKNLQKSLQMMQDVQELLAEQAGYGLSIAISVHEIAKITSNFYYSISSMLKSKHIDAEDKDELEKLRDTSESLSTELKRLGPMRAIRNERPKCISLGRTIEYCIALFSRRFAKAGITVSESRDTDFTVLARFGAVVQVLTNLLDNSCYWLETAPKEKRRVRIQMDATNRTVLIADSGPGVEASIRPYLFRPGYSLREPASGLGLYICKHYMTSASGDIYEAAIRDRVKDYDGAQFVLDFSRVPLKGENE